MATNPYVNKVIYGDQTVIDLTMDTLTASNLSAGVTGHDRSGAPIVGTADYYSPSDTAETTIDDADYFPYYDTSATAKRKSLWSNIKSVLKTYFVSLFVITKTKAEYDALPSAEQNDPDKVYYVPDYEDTSKTWVRLDDTTTANDKVWSSSKIATELSGVAEIDDTSTSATKAWSGSKIQTEINGKLAYSENDTIGTVIDDADYVPYYDYSESARQKITFANIKAKLKTYFDSLYAAISHTHTKSEITDFPTITDTKNTAGSTDTSDKIYLVGAKSQGANPQTYSDNEVFAQNGVLSSKENDTKIINRTVFTGTGTVGRLDTSVTPNIYYPSKWNVNIGKTISDGDTFTIKVPVAGHSYGTYLSADNGTNYYPVIGHGTNRISTQYPVDNYVTFIFDANGSATNIYPVNGGSSTTTVTGGAFRVVNYYDSNTTYSAMSSSELTTGTATTLRTVRADYLKTGVNSLIDTKINALDVTGASNIGAGKTIKAWSETDGKASITTQDISITKSQVSDFPTLATVATTGSYDDLVDEPAVEIAAKGGTTRSLVTTGEKWNWNNSEALHAIQTLAGWDVTAGETLRFPTTGTDDRVTSASKVVPFATAINGRPMKYSSIQAYSGYATVTVAESATNITFTLYVVKPISAHDDN